MAIHGSIRGSPASRRSRGPALPRVPTATRRSPLALVAALLLAPGCLLALGTVPRGSVAGAGDCRPAAGDCGSEPRHGIPEPRRRAAGRGAGGEHALEARPGGGREEAGGREPGACEARPFRTAGYREPDAGAAG